MRITDAGTGDFIDLCPVGFEFPETTGDEHDDNWLVIRGEVLWGGAAWAFEDPALLVSEAQELVRWLTAVSAGDDASVADGIEFLEPFLAFALVDSDRSRVTIAVTLGHEWAPRAAPTGDSPGVILRLVVDRGALRTTADELRDELRAFPARGMRKGRPPLEDAPSR